MHRHQLTQNRVLSRLSGTLIWPLALAGTAGLAWALVAVTSASGDKFGADPWAGLSDDEKQGQVDAPHSENDRFLEEFNAAGRDPRQLARIAPIDGWAAPPATLKEAVAEANLVVVGRVTAISFARHEGGLVPRATVTLNVDATMKGDTGSQLIITQLGGPVVWADEAREGRLVSVDSELMLPGDEVLVLLASGGGAYSPVKAAGIYFLANGTVRPEENNPFYAEAASLGSAAWLDKVKEAIARSATEG